jgi:hypothetical protein
MREIVDEHSKILKKLFATNKKRLGSTLHTLQRMSVLLQNIKEQK